MISSAIAIKNLLDVRGLSISFHDTHVVKGIDFQVASGEVLGIVGESGSGKSLSMLGLLGLVDEPAHVCAEMINFDGQDIFNLSAYDRRKILGNDIGMIFQDPMTSLNPSYTIGKQIAEVLKHHKGLRGDKLKKKVLDLLDCVGIADAKNRVSAYPHQLSGGMNQRAMIAMAIACEPKLLIADEPTTALDVTIQSQVMQLLRTLQKEQNMALLLISHDLGVMFEMADRVMVMYAGEVLEQNSVPEIFDSPRHPYTEALLATMLKYNNNNKRLFFLPGNMPDAKVNTSSCLFAPRCQYADDLCVQYSVPISWPAKPIKGQQIDKRSVFSHNTYDSVLKRNLIHQSEVNKKLSLVRCMKALNQEDYEMIMV